MGGSAVVAPGLECHSVTVAKPVGAVLFRGGKGAAADTAYAVAKWRDSTGRQNYRRVGRAWVEPDGGRRLAQTPRPELPMATSDRRTAERMMDALIDATELRLRELQPDREATFADAAAEWQ